MRPEPILTAGEVKHFIISQKHHRGYFDGEPMYPPNRQDIAVVNWFVDHSIGSYYIVYAVWKMSDGEIRIDEMFDTYSTKEHIRLDEVFISDCLLVVHTTCDIACGGKPRPDILMLDLEDQGITDLRDSYEDD